MYNINFLAFSVVEYSSCADADNAVRLFNGQEMMSRVIHVRLDREAIDEKDDFSDIRLFVGNIPWTLVENDILEHFRSFPPKRIRLMTNMTGRSRGFAILSYGNFEDANAAIAGMNQTNLGGRSIEVSIN